MKKQFFTLILLFVSTLIYSQTLYVPGGVQEIEDSGNGNVGVGTGDPIEKLDVRGDIFIDSGIDDNHIYWGRHNMTMGSRPGDYAHNVFKLKPGGASQGMIYSKFVMYLANSESSHEARISLNTNGNSYFNGGCLGIGTYAPTEGKLHVYNNTTTGGWGNITVANSALRIQDAFYSMYLDGNAIYTNGSMNIGTISNSHLTIGTNNIERIRVTETGKIGIGTQTPSNELEVNGSILAKEIKVETGWADFVFHPTYNLRPLQEVNTYIQQNGHLPEIPTAKEVEENGVSLGEMNAKLLQKIEELTLYTIEQERKIENYDRRFKEQDNRIEKLEDIIKKLQ